MIRSLLGASGAMNLLPIGAFIRGKPFPDFLFRQLPGPVFTPATLCDRSRNWKKSGKAGRLALRAALLFAGIGDHL